MEDIRAYHVVINKLRNFFLEKGFIEVPAQSRASILAACEDPKTIAEYHFNKTIWPLPQTGQMWLEHELLKNPSLKGVFCITTSYRDEPNPIEGRHDKIFPMFEFESKGNMSDLIKTEKELLKYLGFPEGSQEEYNELCNRYHVKELTAEHEGLMWRDINEVVFLKHFPQHTHPFWNMKHKENEIFNKVDVILCGMETIGSIRLKLEHPNFLGVLLYNCGILEARMIETKIMKEINDEINWFPIKIPLNNKAKELIKRLQK